MTVRKNCFTVQRLDVLEFRIVKPVFSCFPFRGIEGYVGRLSRYSRGKRIAINFLILGGGCQNKVDRVNKRSYKGQL